MNTRMNGLVALMGVLVLAGLVGLAQANQTEPAQEQPADATPVVVADCDCGQCATCCPSKYRFVYRQHQVRRQVCCDPCVPNVEMVLQVTDPCTCCPIDVPVCVPGCCTEPPCVTNRGGVLGRSITEFTWSNGFRVRGVHTARDVLVVHTYGA